MGNSDSIDDALCILLICILRLYWQLREHLISLSPVNKQNLEIIESSIISNSLIDEAPLDNTQV